MIAFGVVFVLLLGEIDLSIAYVSGIAGRRGRRVPAARSSIPRLPGRGSRSCSRLAIVAVIGAAQGTVVARIGVPSFVVTLAGLLDLAGRDPQGPPGARLDHHRGQLDQLHRDVLLLRERRLADCRRDHGPVRGRGARRRHRPPPCRPLRRDRDGDNQVRRRCRGRASALSPSATTPSVRPPARRARPSRRRATGRSAFRSPRS